MTIAPLVIDQIQDIDPLSDWDTLGSGPPAGVPAPTIAPEILFDLTAIGPGGNGQYIPHITIAGERWDTLSWNYYGDPTNYSGIIMANPSIPCEPEFEAGQLVKIPIIQALAVAQNSLPPWKTL